MPNRIYYTLTDEAPRLATYSFLPIIKAITRNADINILEKDISLAARILSQFPELKDKAHEDALGFLGELAQKPLANIIKLPNISASVPQIKACIQELQQKGYEIPDYPEHPSTEQEREILSRYNKVKGSSVNPVLREGNSDRRAPKAVKNYAKAHPHSMGAWAKDSSTSVATMSSHDFRHTEKSVCLETETNYQIVHQDKEGNQTILKDWASLQEKEVIDTSCLSVESLKAFLESCYAQAKESGVLFSIHMKATMMKVSDPIIFGHAVKIFLKPLLDEFSAEIHALGGDPNNGLNNIQAVISAANPDLKEKLNAALEACFEQAPDISMVNSNLGITNLHVPSDVIIDASMPAMIRNGGKTWDKNGDMRDALAVIPDSSYAHVYAETIEFCKLHGAFNPSTMGTVPNVGLMAQKAEEYGSHDKTFEIEKDGVVLVRSTDGRVLTEHKVYKGDIWRMCQTKHEPVKNWVQLAVKRARASGMPAIFWLDEERPHDAQLIKKVKAQLGALDTEGLDLRICGPAEATRITLETIKEGKDVISVTGNVLRDYLTDLFPILEVGTSAKMLSIVPLMNGGGLYETGAGGSAPRHVKQFVRENYLRWDSLGEFLALAVSLEQAGEKAENERARILGKTLDYATEKLLLEDKSPARELGKIDNRGSHFYLTMYWAEALSNQESNMELKAIGKKLYQDLSENEDLINEELISVQGKPVDLDGYYLPDEERCLKAMRPSSTFNRIINELA
jgi:isocitrate dehydrogenase